MLQWRKNSVNCFWETKFSTSCGKNMASICLTMDIGYFHGMISLPTNTSFHDLPCFSAKKERERSRGRVWFHIYWVRKNVFISVKALFLIYLSSCYNLFWQNWINEFYHPPLVTRPTSRFICTKFRDCRGEEGNCNCSTTSQKKNSLCWESISY